MPALILIVLFIVVPVAELAVIIEVGQAIGVLPTLVILLADSILGGMLMRAQGRATWRRFNEAARAGRVPHREALDGGLVIFGGALLLTPGFITDVFGVLLLIPPTRAAVRRLVAGAIARRMFMGVVGAGSRRAGRRARSRGSRRAGARREYDVEGSAADVADPGSNGAPPPARGRLER